MSDYLGCEKPQAPVRAGVAVMLVGAAAPVLVGHELDLWRGTWVAAVAGFAAPALLLVAFRLGWLWFTDLVSERVVRRSGQLCLTTFLIGAAARALGLANGVRDLLALAGVVWPLAAAGLVTAGMFLVSAGRDLERRRLGWFTVLMLLVGLATSIAVPNFRAARLRANERACYANQKTIIGAIEMYNLDKNVKLDPTGGYAKYAAELRSGGYLRNIMSDPGQGADSAHHYILTGEAGTGIRCTVHGTWKK